MVLFFLTLWRRSINFLLRFNNAISFTRWRSALPLPVAVEHRFYGKSYPTENMNTSNLRRYLDSEQAFADLFFTTTTHSVVT
jgi:hypothetical protein